MAAHQAGALQCSGSAVQLKNDATWGAPPSRLLGLRLARAARPTFALSARSKRVSVAASAAASNAAVAEHNAALSEHASAPHVVESQSIAPAPGSVATWFERRVLNARFMTLTAVVGSLGGASLCFLKGSILIIESLRHALQHFFSHSTSREILYLVEALDVYLMGTVMLIFALGIYELFIESLDFTANDNKSSFFGLFQMTSRPKWLSISSLEDMKTKLGHVIVMILLVGIFEKSKKVVVHKASELLMFSGSVALAAGCLVLLSQLHPANGHS